MKILVLTTTFPRWENDTIPMFVYELSEVYQKKGATVTVLAPHHMGAKRSESQGNMKIYRFPYFYPARYQKLAYGGGIVSNVKASVLAKIQIPLLFLSGLYYSFKIIKKEKIVIIHSHWMVPGGLIGAINAKVLKVKHILTIHAADLFFLKRLPFKTIIANFIVKQCDKITVVSSHLYEELLQLVSPGYLEGIKNKVEIIPMGIHVSSMRPDKDKTELKKEHNVQAKNILLFIGRLVEKKGLIYLLKAVQKIIIRNSDIELIICGDGPLRKELEQIVRKDGLDNIVRFVGYTQGGRKKNYLALADILIVPSIITKSGDTEGLPVVVLEGLAAGKSIIGTDVGGLGDVIRDGENGFLIEQKNSDQIADKVLELLRNKELQLKFRENSLKAAENYDWERIGQIFFNLCRVHVL
jgi:glycosyltransferase involved in cell wall biosynthesis